LKTLHIAWRVTDVNRSLAFYSALGYVEIGQVGGEDIGRLVFLKFPDDPAVAIELVYRPADGPVVVGNGFSHLAIQVDALAETLASLTAAGLGRDRCSIQVVLTGQKRRGLPIRTGTRSNWWSGRPDMAMA
jgi:lactoylglutathione lyase